MPHSFASFRNTRELLRRALLALVFAAFCWPNSAAAQSAPGVEDTMKPRLTKAPKLVTFAEAEYPESEKAAGKTASVVLELAIDATGHVSAVRVVESAGPAFDAAASDAVRRFVFEPAEVDGRPAPIKIHYRYDFVLREEAPTTAILSGIVRAREDGKPLAGVTVELDDGTRVVTDENGGFRFAEVVPGQRRVLLSRADLRALQAEETLEAGKHTEVIYEVEGAPVAATSEEEKDDLEIVVTAPKLTRQTVSTRVEASQARRVAGTQGDVLKVVENLPGVARATAGSGRLVVWGAAPQDTRVYVDGVRVPLLYHFGGLRSIVHSDLVNSVELAPGGYGAAYGRGLGGLVTVETIDPAEDQAHGSMNLDLLDASAAAHAPLGGNYRFALAGRKSHVGWVLDRFTDRDVEEFFPIPSYYDAQARLRRDFSQRESLEVTGLASGDTVSRSTASRDPADRKRETRKLDFQRVSLRYRNATQDGSSIELVPWFGRDSSTLEARFGGVPTSLEVDTLLYGLRTSWAGRVTEHVTATVGLDLEASSVTARRAGSVGSPPREGDPNVFGQAPSDQVNVDDWDAFIGSAAPFAEADVALFSDTFHVVPGLRLDPHFFSISRRVPTEGNTPGVGAYTSDVAVEPRLSVRWSPIRRVALRAAYGKYRQPPQAEDLSAVFGNPLLGSASGEHWLGGARFEVFSRIAAETTAFYTHSDGLAVRNPLRSPLVGQALLGIGEGRSFGAQFLVRHELTDGFFGWVAYTLLRSERLDRPGTLWRLFDFDQTHVLTALAAYELGAGFDVSARVRFASGYPRTPVVGAFYDARRNLHEPIMGAHNSTRIPGFFQIDARVAKEFDLGGSELEVYLDVQNVTNRENPEELAYSPDYSERRPINGLPILPVAGARWAF